MLTKEQIHRVAKRVIECNETSFNALVNVLTADYDLDVGGNAMRYAIEYEQEIKDASAVILNSDPLHGIPTKRQILMEIIERARATDDDKAYASIMKLYAEISGYEAPKRTESSVVNTSRVMVVRDHGNDQDWRERAAKQQENLRAEARKLNS